MQTENEFKVNIKPINRQENISKLKSTAFDMLIIGGGANGAGVALDAASRGLNCAVIDSFDFASGTSTRSTKMAHGGIRYFQQMMLLDGDPVESYHLLKDTLNERNYFIKAAPYLTQEIFLLIPSKQQVDHSWWYQPGALGQHLIYLAQNLIYKYERELSGPAILTAKKVMHKFPRMKKLRGMSGTMMSEVQMTDGRMNIISLMTSSIDHYTPGMKGATIANYVEFVDFIKDRHGKITGAICRDKISNEEFEIKSSVTVNTTGVHADELRTKDDPAVSKRIIPSRGTHLMFKERMMGEQKGVIIPQTSDGRLIFILDQHGRTMVGTTDVFTDATHYCKPDQQEIDFILQELQPYFGSDYNYQKNMVAAWSGLRPLVKSDPSDINIYDLKERSIKNFIVDTFQSAVRGVAYVVKKLKGKKESTSSVSRNHIIEVSKNGLVSLMGGKWTSYRSQGEETVERIIHDFKDSIVPKLENVQGQTLNFNLVGSYSRNRNTPDFLKLPSELSAKQEISKVVTKNLVRNYGTNAEIILKIAEEEKLKNLIQPGQKQIEAEVVYAIRQEMAVKPNDFICRRIPLGFQDTDISIKVLPKVVKLMQKEIGWSDQLAEKYTQEAKDNMIQSK